MPKGKARGAGLGLGDFQHPGAHVGGLRTVFTSALAASCSDVVGELSEANTPEQVTAWAERHHIDTPWVIDLALRTVKAWATSNSERMHQILADPVTVGEFVPEPEPIEPWTPTIETEAEFRSRVETHISSVKEWARVIGLVPNVSRRALQRDVDAFVAYQVREWDIDAVMEEYFEGLSDDAARKALRQIADDLQIPLRK